MVVAVQVPGRVLHEQPHHLGFGLQFGQRPLHGLVDRQRFAEHRSAAGVFGGPVDAVLGGTQAAGRLPNPVLVQEGLRDFESAVHLTEHRVGGHPDIGQLDLAVVGGHVERPPVVGHRESGCVGRHQERGDAHRGPGLTGGAGEDQVVGGAVHAGVESLGAVDHPAVTVAFGAGLKPGGVRAVLRLGQAERHGTFPGDQRLRPLPALFVGAEPLHHDHLREVPDDRRLVLQVVVQAKTLVRQVFPNDRHVDVAAVATPQRRGQSVPQPARPVGPPPHLGQQVLPFAGGDPVVVPIGAGMLAALVEILDVLALQRFDLVLDERVHRGEHARKVFGQGEIHSCLLTRRRGFSSRSSRGWRWRPRR